MADPNDPVVLTKVSTEAEAAMIAAMLEGQGIDTQTSGELTSGFRAEAPGGVKVLVRQSDLDRAREAMQQCSEPEA